MSSCDGSFRVKSNNGHVVLELIADKAYETHLLLSDESVAVELTPYDLTRTRIVFRAK
jgi:translation initiation factor IF-1